MKTKVTEPKPERSRFRMPIRWKIVLLIAGSLAVSLLFYILMGTEMMVTDKVSYIYDYNLTKVQSISGSLENQLSKLDTTAKLIARVSGGEGAPETVTMADSVFQEHASLSGMQALLLLRPSDNTRFSIERTFGPRSREAETLIAQLAWTPAAFHRDEMLVAPAVTLRDGLEVFQVAARATDREGKPLAYFALVSMDMKFSSDLKNFDVRIIDSNGATIYRSAGAAALRDEEFDRSLISGTFASGVRNWKHGSAEYVIGYQRVSGNRLIVIGYTPRSVAFEAAEALAQRSVVLGLAVLLIGIGVTLLFAKSLTARLRQMWNVTEKISTGDFTVRAQVKRAGAGDEITDLATSFNMMADKIDELMKKSAQKALLESELETAQMVQGWFFPTSSFKHPNIVVDGQFVPATKCAGDWWSYFAIGDYVVMVIGDVTGHGASAALITAVGAGAFSAYMQHVKADQKVPDVGALTRHINEAIYGASNGKVTMTFLAASINVRTGVMEMCNASHCTPYIYRPGPSSELAGNPLRQFVALMDGKCDSLGYGPDLQVTPAKVQLQANDMIFWYTDGLFECENNKGQPIGKTKLLKAVAEMHHRNGIEAGFTCQDIMTEFMTFLAAAVDSRMDDVTVVVGSVSKDVVFEQDPEFQVQPEPAAEPDVPVLIQT